MSFTIKSLRSANAVLTVALAVAASPTSGAPALPQTVSPGSTDGSVVATSPCPQFNWSVVEGTQSVEINVFRLDDFGNPETLELGERVAGAASGWSPDLDRCLTPGHRYAWTVRMLTQDGFSDWSQARLFRVALTAVPGDFEVAVEQVVQRMLRTSDTFDDPDGANAPGASNNPNPRTHGLGAGFGVDGAGNVRGHSFTGSGSGLTGLEWSNLVNLPVGFADGVDDNSDTLAMLSCANGQVPKRAGGVWTCGNDLDSLGDLSCNPDEVARFSGSVWQCLPLTVDNVGAVIPGQPNHLRLRPDHRSPGKRRLEWNVDSLAGVASFVVYHADFPITVANKSSAARKVTSSLYAAVDLFPGSGIQHFRVEGVNVLGQAGALSDELTVDTASRLAYQADQRTDDLVELFVVPAVGGGATRVSDDLIPSGDVDGFSWSPDASRLAYLADQDTDEVFELHVVSAAGGSAVTVSDPLVAGGDVSDFAWSPDGTRLAYRADQDVDEVFELYVVPAVGGVAVKVSDPLTAGGDVTSDYFWSPDGTRIAYQGDQETDDVFELFVVSETGGGATKVNDPLVTGGDVSSNSAWAPDGTRLAYRADQEVDQVFELYVVAATGGGATKVSDPLVAGGDVSFSGFAWSPDGSRVGYIADQNNDTADELFVAPATGGGTTRVNDPLVAGGSVMSFSWSPDAGHLAYRGDQDTDQDLELYAVPAAGGGASKVNDELVPNGDVFNAIWSPEASRLAYRGSQDSAGVAELYVAPAFGAGSIKINDPLVADGEVFAFAWSADGSRLAYSADQVTDEIFELYVAPAAAGDPLKVNDTLVAGGIVGSFAWSPLGAE